MIVMIQGSTSSKTRKNNKDKDHRHMLNGMQPLVFMIVSDFMWLLSFNLNT